MPVRNYDNPDPKAVLRNVAGVLKNQDMGLLHEPAYRFLITHCGFIAHYDLAGFKATYRDHLDGFVQEFLEQGLGSWEVYLNNSSSYLYDTSYRGVMLHEIVRDLLSIFQRYQDQTNTVAEARRRAQKVATLNRLAGELGYTVAPKEEVEAITDRQPTRKAFKVAAVSMNRNSFGLRSMVVVAPDGEAYRVLSNDLNIKREGQVLLVEQRDGWSNFAALGYEVPEKLPTAPPDVVKEVDHAQET